MSLPEVNISFLKKIEKTLRDKKIPSSAVEAERLVLHFMRSSRVDFFTGEKTISEAQKKKVEKALKDRLSGIPLAYLTGVAGFWGMDFQVNHHTLIPRPETELLVEETLKRLQIPVSAGMTAPKILEMGAGSGCVAVSLTMQRPDCRMTALDVSLEALKIARKNARFHGVEKRISFFQSDLFSVFTFGKRAFWDVIVSNPPYIPTSDYNHLPREVRREPRLALDGGRGGLRIIESILEKAPYYLKEGGFLLMEIGKGQARAVRKKAAATGFYRDMEFVKDYAGIDRIFVARNKAGQWIN